MVNSLCSIMLLGTWIKFNAIEERFIITLSSWAYSSSRKSAGTGISLESVSVPSWKPLPYQKHLIPLFRQKTFKPIFLGFFFLVLYFEVAFPTILCLIYFSLSLFSNI